MKECDYCQHVEMCGWRKSVGGKGCAFFGEGLAIKQEPKSHVLDEIRAEIMSKEWLERAPDKHKVGEKIPPEEWQKGKTITEIIDEVRERMCNEYCKYPYEWDEETQGELSESEICAGCPLNRL